MPLEINGIDLNHIWEWFSEGPPVSFRTWMAGDGGVALAQREMLASESDLGWLERPLLLGIGRRDNLRTAGGREGRNGFGTSLVDCDDSTIETLVNFK